MEDQTKLNNLDNKEKNNIKKECKIMKKHYVYGEEEFNLKDSEGTEYVLKVEVDDCAEDPREWDNVAKIWTWKRGYRIGDKPFGDAGSSLVFLCEKYTSLTEEEIEDMSIKEMLDALHESKKIKIMEVYCYEHSDITISVTNGYPYNDRWDGGTIGIAFIDKETALSELGGIPLKDENGEYIKVEHKHENAPSTYSIKFDPITEENWEEVAEYCIKGEMETLDCYVRGDVYGYTLTKKVHICEEEICPHCGKAISSKEYDEEEEVDSCWGFYGNCIEENGILDNIGSDLIFVE